MKRLITLGASAVLVLLLGACTPPPSGPGEPPVLPDSPGMHLPDPLGDVTLRLLHRGPDGTEELVLTRAGSRPLTSPLSVDDRALVARMDGRLDPATRRVLIGYESRPTDHPELAVCSGIDADDCRSIAGTQWAPIATFSPDGTMIAAVTPYGPFGDSIDGRLQIFDAETLDEVARADDAITMLQPPRWRPDSGAVAFTRLAGSTSAHGGDLVSLAAAPDGQPEVVVRGTPGADVTNVLGWSTSGRIAYTTIDSEGTWETTLRSIDDEGLGPARLLMASVDAYVPGVALPDGTVLANPPGGATRPAVVHLVVDTPAPRPSPLSVPVSWVQGSSTRWSNTTALGALVGS